ncbi:MAG: DUF3244 domain-containing protein [Paludibacter sp.]
MKISKSWFLRICLITGLVLSAQFSFASDPILLPPDGGQKTPPSVPNVMTTLLPSASATISDTELAVYFDYSVGDATITVYDADNNVVYQETVDTDSTSEVSISVGNWFAGDYMITVTYGSTTQRGYFSIE